MPRFGIDRFQAIDGSAATPSFSFLNDLDCGFYRIGANNVGFAVNGSLIYDVDTSGITFNSLAVDGLTTITGYAAASSLTIAGHVTGGAAAQRDIIIRTGDATNPQALATRVTIGSNAAEAAIAWANSNHTGLKLGGAMDANSQNITSLNNVGIGVSAWGTNAARVIGIGNGTAPTTAPADMVQFWSGDYAAGDARSYLRSESGVNLIFGNGAVLASATRLTLGVGTTDGSDNADVVVAGAGVAAYGRGGYVLVYGNEAVGGTGDVIISCGEGDAGANIGRFIVATSNIQVFRVNASGNVIAGSGEGGTTAATGNTLRAPDITTGGAGNIAGAILTIAGGLGTGTGTGNSFLLRTPANAAAGDNLQALSTRLAVTGGVATAVATWTSVTHSGFTLGGAMDANSQALGTAASLTCNALTLGGTVTGNNQDITAIKHLGLSNTAVTATDIIKFAETFNNAAVSILGINASMTFTGTTGNNTFKGIELTILSQSTTAGDTGSVFGIDITSQIDTSNAAQDSWIMGVVGRAYKSGGANNQTGGVMAVQVRTWGNSGGAGTLDEAYGVYVSAPDAAAGRPITTAAGIKIESCDVTGITTKYSIIGAGGGNLDATGTTWANGSSKEIKDDLGPVDYSQVLSLLDGVDMRWWKYKHGDNQKRLGLYAEDVPDFLGMPDRKSISPMYPATLALAGVKGLQARIAELEAKIAVLEAR